MFYGCRNPWIDFKYKFIIFSTQYLTVLKVRAIMYLEIRKGINKEPSFKKLTPLEVTMLMTKHLY